MGKAIGGTHPEILNCPEKGGFWAAFLIHINISHQTDISTC
jgi:hypothetical protein